MRSTLFPLRRAGALVCLAAAVACFAAGADHVKALDGFDAIVQSAMKEWQVPGVAVGVMLDGKVVLARGYGHRDVARELPVTPQTIFAVGSISKSFTAAVVALQVDEGKLKWDTPVREYLPWFRLHDPAASELITVRDMLTHRSGLPRHDFIRMSVPLSRKELLIRTRYLEPSRSFRDVYQYNNLMYVAAGYLAGQVAGSTWEQLVQERLFVPLGMTRSTTSVADSQRTGDFSRAYVKVSNRFRDTPLYDYQRFGVGPNGAVNSNVEDLLKYLQFQLDGGQAGGKQIISQAQMRAMHTPYVVVDESANYGLGWKLDTLGGRRRISHGGAITGFQAFAAIFPEQKLSVVVLSNLDLNPLPPVLADMLAERMLGLPQTDRLASVREREARARRQRQEAVRQRQETRVYNTKPSRNLELYAGEYEHPAYGVARVTLKYKRLNLVFPAQSAVLSHYHYDTFNISGAGLTGRLAQFQLDERGEVHALLLPLEPAVNPIVFHRRTN